MTSRERENATLLFIKPKDRGSVETLPLTATRQVEKEGHGDT